MTGWAEAARAAEERGAWGEAISLVSAFADCKTLDYRVRDAHLWHMQLLAKAGRLDVLAQLAETCKHARRQFNRHLVENGQADELHRRAQDGDTDALYRVGLPPRTVAGRWVVEMDGLGVRQCRSTAACPCH
jgi:hypothetical protein